MYNKIVVFGGGTGISYLLRGLKDFPVDITAVIAVSDNGRSTGKLRKEFHTPAVGDIRKVITNLSQIDEPIKDMMSYRFKTSSDLDGHAVGNLILTAMLDITGSLKESTALSTAASNCSAVTFSPAASHFATASSAIFCASWYFATIMSAFFNVSPTYFGASCSNVRP